MAFTVENQRNNCQALGLTNNEYQPFVREFDSRFINIQKTMMLNIAGGKLQAQLKVLIAFLHRISFKHAN